ncbi:MAG: DUF1059 domain-containing protein [Microgenomates group bacterium]
MEIDGDTWMEFHAETFEDMARLSQQHGGQMTADPAHATTMADMSRMMQDPTAMQAWMHNKQAEFDELP